jgi:outer membrane protein
MRKFAVALAVLASLTSSAIAAEGPFMVRARGIFVSPANKNTAIGGAAGTADTVSLSDKFIPEVDFSYFFLVPNLSAELILTYPQKHNVKVDGNKIGTVTHLPPCLTAQWHFLPGFVANPYVGAGVNLTLLTAQDLPSGLKLDKTSVGFAGQVGVDVKVAEQIYVNADVKYVTPMSFALKASDGTKLSTVTVSPWLLGVGVGYRF